VSSRFSSRAALAQLSAPPATRWRPLAFWAATHRVVCDGDHFGNYQRAEMQILREAGIPFWVNDVQKVEEVNGRIVRCLLSLQHTAYHPCSALPITPAVHCLPSTIIQPDCAR